MKEQHLQKITNGQRSLIEVTCDNILGGLNDIHKVYGEITYDRFIDLNKIKKVVSDLKDYAETFLTRIDDTKMYQISYIYDTNNESCVEDYNGEYSDEKWENGEYFCKSFTEDYVNDIKKELGNRLYKCFLNTITYDANGDIKDEESELIYENKDYGKSNDAEYDAFLTEIITRRRVNFHPDDEFEAEDGIMTESEAKHFNERLNYFFDKLGEGVYQLDLFYYANKELKEEEKCSYAKFTPTEDGWDIELTELGKEILNNVYRFTETLPNGEKVLVYLNDSNEISLAFIDLPTGNNITNKDKLNQELEEWWDKKWDRR